MHQHTKEYLGPSIRAEMIDEYEEKKNIKARSLGKLIHRGSVRLHSSLHLHWAFPQPMLFLSLPN